MKKLFLLLIVAGFAFASCGKKPSSEQEAACSKKEEGKCCAETLVIVEEVVDFVDSEDVEVED